MALFREGDIVAVQLDSDYHQWAYGLLRHAGYGLRCWTVEFSDGVHMSIPHERIREDERDRPGDATRTPARMVGIVEMELDADAAEKASENTDLAAGILDEVWAQAAPAGAWFSVEDTLTGANGKLLATVHVHFLKAAGFAQGKRALAPMLNDIAVRCATRTVDGEPSGVVDVTTHGVARPGELLSAAA